MTNPNEASLSSFSDHLADAVEAASAFTLRVGRGRRIGTGTVWAPGLVVTTHRSTGSEGPVPLTLPDGREVEGELVGRDPATDLALVRLPEEAADLPAATASERSPRVGNITLALGRPGSGVRAALGMVSAIGDAWHTSLGGAVDRWIEVDGTLPPGYSGGALLAADGSVLGINTRALVRGGTTLPAATVSRVVARLEEGGDGEPGWLGVRIQAVRTPDAEGAEVDGLLITGARSTSPAATAGLRVGDILTGIAGDPTPTHAALLAATSHRAGKEVEVTFLRGGKLTTLAVELGTRPQRRSRRGSSSSSDDEHQGQDRHQHSNGGDRHGHGHGHGDGGQGHGDHGRGGRGGRGGRRGRGRGGCCR